MITFRKPAAAAVAALALAALPVTAEAHGGDTPFENCSEAYADGHADIPSTSAHYGEHLDRDGDGIGCDRPPADFVPATEDDNAGGTDSGAHSGDDSGTAAGDGAGTDTGTGDQGGGTDLAETGGGDATPYLAAGGAVVLLVGSGVVFAARRRRDAR